MSAVNKTKILTGLVILLVLANITTMLFCGLKYVKPRRQQERYMALVSKHRSKLKPISNGSRNYKYSLFCLLSQQHADDSIKKNAPVKIISINSQRNIITFHHFKKVITICNLCNLSHLVRSSKRLLK